MTNLHTATALQRMASNEGNNKIAFVMTGLSVVLLATMTLREVSHALQEQLRSHDKKTRDKDR